MSAYCPTCGKACWDTRSCKDKYHDIDPPKPMTAKQFSEEEKFLERVIALKLQVHAQRIRGEYSRVDLGIDVVIDLCDAAIERSSLQARVKELEERRLHVEREWLEKYSVLAISHETLERERDEARNVADQWRDALKLKYEEYNLNKSSYDWSNDWEPSEVK